MSDKVTAQNKMLLVETSTLLSSEVASCKMFKNVSENAVDQVVISWDWEKINY